MKFDPREIKKLPAGSNVGIDGFPGLRIVVSATTRAWTYRYREDDKLRQKKLGEWPAMEKGKAIAAWQAAKDERATGVDIAPKRKKQEPVVEPGAYTVDRLLTEYLVRLETVKKRSPSSLRAVTAMFKRLPEDIRSADPLTITRKKAHDLIESYSDRPALAIKLKSELGAAWKAAINSGKFDDEHGDTHPRAVNYWPDCMSGELKSSGRVVGGKRNVGAAKTVEKRVLNDVELGAVLKWLKPIDAAWAKVLELTLRTGSRSGEVVQLHTDHLTTDATGALTWRLPKALTKNAKVASAGDHVVSLVGRAADIVKALQLQRKNGYLFPGAKGHLSQNEVGETLNRRMPYDRPARDGDCPVLGFTAHDLRRSCRTKLTELGVIHEVGEAVLGHVLSGVAGIYQRHGYFDERRDALTRLDVELERLAA